MIALIAFCVLFFVCAVAASGTAKLIYISIQEGEILGKWQNVLNSLEPEKGQGYYFFREFWYKRLGGCILCMRQFIAELSFILLCGLWLGYADFPTHGLGYWRLFTDPCIFIAFCGTTLQIGQWLEYEKRQADNEPIIETRYKNPN